AIREIQPTVSPDIGWNAFQARIQANQHTVTNGWGERWKEWLSHFQQGKTWTQRPAAICFALVAIIMQAGVIGALLLEQEKLNVDPALYRGWTTPATSSPVLRVRFKPDTPEKELRLLLAKVEGEIIAGPNQLGDYTI